MKAEFTSGKWKVVDSTGQSMSVWASESECITTINYNFWNEKYQDELKANAHLIAAAPDMYKMIESLKCELFIMIDEVNDQRLSRVTSQTENQPDLVDMESIHLAEVLLAKARGVDNE